MSKLRAAIRFASMRVQRALNIHPRGFCMILANPRSGSSAFHDWLGKQSRIMKAPQRRMLIGCHRMLQESNRYTYGDFDAILARLQAFIRDYYNHKNSSIGKLITDKENFEPICFPDHDHAEYISNIRKMLPGCRIIFLVRDPVASIWSMRKRKWGYSLKDTELFDFTVEEAIEIWNRTAQTMLDHKDGDDIFVVHFEDLVKSPDVTSKAVLNFLNVPMTRAFEPQPTKDVGFDESDLEKIRQATNARYEALQAGTRLTP